MKYVVVEHNGHGPGHKFRVVNTYETLAEAYERIKRSNTNAFNLSKRYRPLHVQKWRADGRYDLFDSDDGNE